MVEHLQSCDQTMAPEDSAWQAKPYFIEIGCNYLFDWQAKIPILVRFTNFCDFHDFWKAVATAFLGISKIPMVNFEIKSFSFYLSKKFCFPATQICAPRR